jgi:hypothetical protein
MRVTSIDWPRRWISIVAWWDFASGEGGDLLDLIRESPRTRLQWEQLGRAEVHRRTAMLDPQLADYLH